MDRCYATLEAQLPLVKGTPESAQVQAQLAQWLSEMDKPVKSHALLQECVQAGLTGPGTARCQEQLDALLAPSVELYGSLHHAPGSAVLHVHARNVPTLYFRAYRVLDVPNVLSATQGRFRWQREKNQTEIFEKNQWISLLKTWSMEVPNTGDFTTQELKVTPQLPGKGVYWVLVSNEDTFLAKEDSMQQMLLIQTELAFVVRAMEREVEALVVNANTGAPEAGVNVHAEGSKDDDAPSLRYRLEQTNHEGKTSLKETGSYFVFWASRGEDIAVAALNDRRYGNSEPEDDSDEEEVKVSHRALISMDRTLYRPGQPLFYKVVLLRSKGAGFAPAANQQLKVFLDGLNGRNVETQNKETNAFGSISGEFNIPAEDMLGWWELHVHHAKGECLGGTSFAVAEYKRPSFEVRFLEKQEEMKLNAPVKLKGEARYYFGQPLPRGKVKWRVLRKPRWLKWGWRPKPDAQFIAQGESMVGADGRFEVNFVAEADPLLKEDVAYLYEVKGNVLDEGGETQPLSHRFHVGTRALNPVFQVEGAPLFATRKPIRLPVFNQNLDGVGQKGKGFWKLYALNSQGKRDMGEELTEEGVWDAEEEAWVSTDSSSTPGWQRRLRTWGEGELRKQGEISLDVQGKGVVNVGSLPRGAFRVLFETRDAFGNPCQTEQELLVVDSHLGQPFDAWAQLEKEEVKVGETLKLLLSSQHEDQAFYVELFRKKLRLAAQWIRAGDAIQEFTWRVQEEDRGGLEIRVLSIREFGAHSMSKKVIVPWDNKELALSFSSFRDKLRPGDKERFVLSVSHKGKPVGKGEAEVLGLMYDRSLDVLREHTLPTLQELYEQHEWPLPKESVSLHNFTGVVRMGGSGSHAALSSLGADHTFRQNFSETAFFLPSLTTDERGQVAMDFEVPDALTSWKVMASAHSKLGQGSPVLTQETQTSKELMVRPYVPRFLREGDEATLAVVVNNMSDKALSGELVLELFEPDTHAPLSQSFGLQEPKRAFRVPAQGLVKLEFALKVPMALGSVAIKAVAKAGEFSDGEQRLVPILPSRMHLAQSRFVALKGKQEKHVLFEDMAKTEDSSRVDERLVVTLDGQLLAGVLEALPYLASYPYECTEQTFNRFFSAGMVASVFRQNPQLSQWAAQLSQKRTTPLARDSNRKLALEETPFSLRAQGDKTPEWMQAVHLLEPGAAQNQADASLEKLHRAQNADGGFPWFEGGRSSIYLTNYMLVGFARAREFSIPIPGEMVKKAWAFLKEKLEEELSACMKKGGCVEDIVLTNYAASLFDASLTGMALETRKTLLAYAETQRQTLAPRLRILTALTLHHMKENQRAREWLESWMQLSHETENEGRFWAPESMSWVWQNDTLENHALTLHALTKISPGDVRAEGLVQWLFLQKKLSHWRSTRTTAEVLYAVVGHMKSQNTMGQTERLEVQVGPEKKEFVFEPSNLESGKQQWVLEGKEIQPHTMGRIRVAQKTDGFHFASATWHFSTQRFPTKGDGDLFAVSRAYFRRVPAGSGFKLIPLKEGEALRLGEEVEVQLTLKTKAPAEYVHLRDVRAAGLEPRTVLSGWKWEKGYACYEEVRDSAQNYFFENLPQGEFRFSYRLVANMAGSFRLGPAVVQSMYAPEFAAYSQGHVLNVIP